MLVQLSQFGDHRVRAREEFVSFSQCVLGLAVLPLLAWAQPPEAWNANFQSTAIWQSHGAFESPDAGPHSLTGQGEGGYSLSVTAAFGWRPLAHTELYADVEGIQGDPFSHQQGLAQFSDGEMTRAAGSTLVVYRARLFARQIFPLAEESDPVESDANQLGGFAAKRRVVLTGGFLSVQDLFDANACAHDPRTQFMNLAFVTYPAWDYPADARGYTWGVAAELFEDGWGVRGGRFTQPKAPNGLALDTHVGEHYGDAIEAERRVDLLSDEPGTVRLLAFHDRAVMARYDDALALADATARAPDLASVRNRNQDKIGLGVDLEQQVAGEMGLFGRAMWADGKTETYAYTESDRSLSAGATMRGTRWGRPKDALGVAWGESLIAQAHRQYLERGGITFFLGDGRLDYHPEQVIEAYYLVTPFDHAALTFDVQRIASPAYDGDRGPVTFAGIRLHLEL